MADRLERRDPADVTGYTDFAQDADGVSAVAHYPDGFSERVGVRVSVERQITRADGAVEPLAEVASTDDGSVKIAAGAAL